MSYDAELEIRVQKMLKGTRGLEQKKMFGGVGFMIGGNMACGILKDDLIVRVDPARHEAMLKRPHVKPFDTMGRPMAGWILVAPAGCTTERSLEAWVKMGATFARSLPPK